MAGDWKRVILADVIDVISGGTPKTSVSDYWDGDIPWLSVADFNTGYRWVSAAAKAITNLGLTESATSVLDRGDIIISARGTVGVVAQLAKPMAFNQSCYGLRGREGIVETDFIYYALCHCVSGIKQVAHGGVFDTITRDTFKIISIDLPPLPEQRAIASILGSLDDKIELNRRTNETLEVMARALFKSWFVDFTPVRAKAEGREPGLPRVLGDLFPNAFEDSEFGEVPKEWTAKPFATTVDITGGGTPNTSVDSYWNGDVPWFSVADAPVDTDVWVIDTIKKITREGVEKSSTQVLPIGTTIISARGTVGRIALVGTPMAMNQSCYGLRGKGESHGLFTYFATRDLVARLQQRAHGSVFDTITRETLSGVSVAVPPPALVKAFETRVGPSMDRIRAGLFESRLLAALRDTMLPKLISGEIRVNRVRE